MSLEIGYDFYENGKIIDNGHDNWACGRNEINYAWGHFFSAEHFPVFQPELEGLKYYELTGKYVKFEDFKKVIIDACETAERQHWDDIRHYQQRQKEILAEIKELRELQKTCTEKQSFAFDKWTEEINDLRGTYHEYQEFIDGDGEDADFDTDYARATDMRKRIRTMEEDMKNGKVLIPFYSY